MRGIPEGEPASKGIVGGGGVNPAITEGGFTMPDNPYTRQLEAITGGRATVSLPPPVPMPSEVPIGRPPDEPIADNPAQFAEKPRVVFSPIKGFLGIDLLTSAVVSDADEAFVMTESEVEEAQQLCCRVLKRTLSDQIARIESRMKPKKAKRGPRKK